MAVKKFFLRKDLRKRKNVSYKIMSYQESCENVYMK